MRACLLICVLILSSATAMAAPGDFLFQVQPNSPLSNADFGDAVAISDGIVVVGEEDRNAGAIPSAGAVYLFDATTGTQLQMLTTTDPPATRQFGNAVDIEGTKLVIGAEDENTVTGAAYIFDTSGNQLHKLLATGGGSQGDEFGQAVGISGSVAVVGAPNVDNGTGNIYLYDVDTGAAIGGAIRPNDLPSFAEFGTTLSMDGDRIIVGMDRLGNGGSVYVYDNAGILQYKIDAPIDSGTSQPVPGFARSVSISGDRAIVGATPDDTKVGPTEFGRAFIYDVPTGNLLHELIPSDSQPEDLFGEDVAISGNVAAVVARREDVLGLVNKAYLFDVTTGLEIAVVDGLGIPAGTEIFEAIALDAGRLVAGHESYSSGGFTNNGRALVFDAFVPLPGDANGDGTVDLLDLDILGTNFGLTPATFAQGDFNGDGTVDLLDLDILGTNFGAGSPATTVPEPASAALLAMLLSIASLSRRNNH